MTDLNSPDQGPKPPFKFDPNKKLFDPLPKTGNDEPRSFANPEPDTGSQDQTPATDQEVLFRAAAIRCAQMEEELYQLIWDTPPPKGGILIHDERFGKKTLGVYIGRSEYSKGQVCTKIASYIEDISSIRPNFPGRVRIAFEDNNGGRGYPTIDTKRELTIDIHGDDPTQEAFTEAVRRNPEQRPSTTHYYFNEAGDYKKVVNIPYGIEVDPKRKPLIENGRSFESEITLGDFEFAGRVLQMLINRLKPQEEKPAE